MFGLNALETYLAVSLALVVVACAVAISLMTERHQTIRDQRRRARRAARAAARRSAGLTVRPKR